jgi:hypothetical protein
VDADVGEQQTATFWIATGVICPKSNLYIGTTDESLGGITGVFDKRDKAV